MFCSKNGQKLSLVTEQLTRSYEDRFGVNYTNRDNLPRRSEIVSVTDKLLALTTCWDGKGKGPRIAP